MSDRYYHSPGRYRSSHYRSRSRHDGYDDSYYRDYAEHYRRYRSYSRSSSPRYRGRHSRSRSRRRYNRRSTTRSPFSTRKRHIGDRDNPEPSRVLGIFGLSLDTQERDLREIFSKYGRISELQIVHDKKTGRSRGFAFIYFENMDDAIAAKDSLSGTEIDGHKIRIDFSITKRPHTPTPGIYLGKPTVTHFSRNSYYRGGGGYYDSSRGMASLGSPYGGGSSYYGRYRKSPSYNRYGGYSGSRSRSRSRSYYNERRYRSRSTDRSGGYR